MNYIKSHTLIYMTNGMNGRAYLRNAEPLILLIYILSTYKNKT